MVSRADIVAAVAQGRVHAVRHAQPEGLTARGDVAVDLAIEIPSAQLSGAVRRLRATSSDELASSTSPSRTVSRPTIRARSIVTYFTSFSLVTGSIRFGGLGAESESLANCDVACRR